MSEYLTQIQTVMHRFTVESLADMTIGWMGSRKLLENPSTIIFSGFNPESIDSCIKIVARATCAHFFYPRVSTPFALMNASIGLIHLGIGVSERFKIIESPKDAPEKWNAVALHIHKAFAHLITAQYDFWIGYFLAHRPYGLLGVAAFVGAPAIAALWHQRVFVKPGEKQILSEETRSDLSEKLKGYVQSDVLNTILNPPEEDSTPPAKVIPTYLDQRCYIYIFAKKITLELMPATEKNDEGIVARVVKVGKRISGIGLVEGDRLPDYGL